MAKKDSYFAENQAAYQMIGSNLLIKIISQLNLTIFYNLTLEKTDFTQDQPQVEPLTSYKCPVSDIQSYFKLHYVYKLHHCILYFYQFSAKKFKSQFSYGKW